MNWRARKSLLVGVVITIVAMAVLVAPGSTQQTKKEPYKIGAVYSLTGYLSMIGEDIHKGTVMAVEEINAAGGVDGHPLKLIVEDEKSAADAAVAGATKLINEDKALMVIHCNNTGAATAVKAITDRAKIPFMTFTCYDPKVLTEGEGIKYFFAPSVAPDREVKRLLAYILKEKKTRRIGLMQDTGFYGTLLKDALMKQAPPLGFSFVAHEQYATRDIDVTPQVTREREAKPDMVIAAGPGNGPAITAKAMKLLGLNVQLYSFAGAYGKILEQSAEAAEGIIFLTYRDHVWNTIPADDPYHDITVRWTEKYHARFGKYQNWMQGPQAYDAINVVALALKKSGPDRAKLLAAIEGIKDYRGVLGTWSFSSTNHISNEKIEDRYIFATIMGGKLQYFTR